MSLTKARERAESQTSDKPGVDSSLLCTAQGCKRAWTTTFFGRLCSLHEAEVTGSRGVPRPVPVPVPRIPPQPHWLDERDVA